MVSIKIFIFVCIGILICLPTVNVDYAHVLLEDYKNGYEVTHSFLVLCTQDQVDAAVKQLLVLKTEYKQATGQDYKPGAAPVQKAPAAAPVQNKPNPAPAATNLYERVAEQGEVVRKLKVEKASKVRFHGHSCYCISICYQCFPYHQQLYIVE